ncbi:MULTISPECIES: transposase [unclassified Lentimonas]|uniref:transposase n=1 Tax=unclassified Lentimonas TaxID=2630993 RepID=UPI001322EEB7|nr:MULTISPECIES: transposase [unclassified Lentimonas]CAA6676997.1 Unannotated [Lentimonas sp. CC4]CAA6686803.1 Unannotated [Lentimonas sp. CC6]CAA7075619.1 Unannotated [Lentimonas sp. CC4]CAA7168223.1 Unannotated [Lentimonas sp. CC21]CAA7181626.1 Unannotated [Lentimonas sp. CC8]
MLQAGKDFEYFKPLAEVEMLEANLPHWHQDGALYFVTFRLADSIPKEKLSQWKHEFEQWLTRNPKPWNKEQLDEYQTHFARKIEVWLDRGYGSNLFRDPSYAQIVEDCLLKFDQDRYKIDCYTIASNHAHALVVPTRDNELHGILKSWKGVSARNINKVRRTNGTIWQKESYDHIVRNASSLERIRKYIRDHKT